MRPGGPNRQSKAVRANHTLFERLRSDDLQIDLPGRDSLTARLESIRASLVRLLNSRGGLSAASAGYGLEDFNDATIGSSDMMRVVARDIERTITANEPRVQNVRVEFDRSQAGSLELFFRISATTVITRKSEQVVIDLVLSDGRNFRLR